MTYSQYKKSIILRLHDKVSKERFKKMLSILESTESHDIEIIALVLYDIYMHYSYQMLHTMINYFWCSKVQSAQKQFRVWHEKNFEIGQSTHISVILQGRLNQLLTQVGTP